jgi:hypothetical protein
MLYIVSIALTVAFDLGKRKVVRVEREEAKMFEGTRGTFPSTLQEDAQEA